MIAAPTAPGGPAYVSTANGGSAQCVQASPQLETVVLRGGGTAQVCTRGDGTLTGWRSPQYAQGVIGGALTSGMMQGARLVTQGAVQLTNALPTPPKGYRLAWKDDRLNPLRGVGTALGQAQQDQVWTRDIPATEIVVAPAVAPPRIALSTMSAPDTQNATQSGASYVQIGTFGQPANAEAAKARLTALGLPVSMRNITSKGRVLQVVYAGPFANLAQSQAALATTRSAGFRDAILK
ncbi:MAG: SPOR domain-containing protein [Candidatus Saccharibacteria bacterium]|nr:SPOR domain-containing protein [Pseudorhodobacter sp.]